ncbi:MAG: ATP-binding cassette domain-containing protein, partial [Chloroflexota bacterium]
AALMGLGVADIPRDRPLTSLSGGEASRVALAGLVVGVPDVLLLDEPTNHLDVNALDWLEATLRAYSGAVLVVSHDRAFLNAFTTRIIEIDRHTRTATSHPGNYDAYAANKAAQAHKWREDYDRQQDEIKTLQSAIRSNRGLPTKRNIKTSDGDKHIKHFKGQTADKTHTRDLNSLEDRLRRIQADPVPRPPRPLVISPEIDPAALHGDAPVVVQRVCVAYDAKPILRDVSFTLHARERLAITGENGAGKSTLLRVIVGEHQPDAGSVSLAKSVRLGYLPQTDTLSPDQSLIEAYGDGLPGDYEDHKAALIGEGWFTYPELDTRTGALSAGQRRKVQLARLAAMNANVLVLDEPTNHLSLDVLEAFEHALETFPGVVIAVSHDRHFLRRFGGERLTL